MEACALVIPALRKLRQKDHILHTEALSKKKNNLKVKMETEIRTVLPWNNGLLKVNKHEEGSSPKTFGESVALPTLGSQTPASRTLRE